MKLVIQIPCFNEEKTLPVTISELPKAINGIDEIEILVIDDGSSDNTVKIAKEHGAKVAQLHIHKGLAKAFKTGLDTALEMGADIIVNTDADNQYCAKDIEKLVKPILNEQADIVIGSRPVSDIRHFSLLKKFLQRFGSFVVRTLSSTKVEDAPSGFRAFSRNAAMQLNVFDNYTYTLETIIQAQAKGLQIECVDINVNENLRKSRLFNNMLAYINHSIITMLRMFIVYRPFRFFASLGVVALLAGTTLGGRFIYYYLTGGGKGHIQSLILAAIFILAGVQLGIFAALAEIVSINRKLLEDIQYKLKAEKLNNK